MSELEYKKIYNIQLGCSDSRHAMFIGMRWSNLTRRSYFFLLRELSEPFYVYSCSGKEIEFKEDKIRLKRFSQKKPSSLEKEYIHDSLLPMPKQ